MHTRRLGPGAAGLAGPGPGSGGSRGNGSGGSSGSMAGGSMGMMTGGAGGSSVIGPGGVPIEAGRVTIRRLNKLEYDNTVRDLLGINLAPSKMFDFVDDEWGDGFNNDADVLSLSPLAIEKYLTSAQFLIDKALDPAPANATVRNKIMVCTVPQTPEADCGRRIIGDFAKRAFRRPPSAEDVNAFVALIDVAKKQGDNFEAGIKVALAGVLVAPDFLFRAEVDPTPGTERPLDNWELASRLSYFVWASMPDDELFQKAEQKALTNPSEIASQVRRMLGDPKVAGGFTTAMVEQWMQTLELRQAKPDTKFYPTWQAPLRDAMEQEVRATARADPDRHGAGAGSADRQIRLREPGAGAVLRAAQRGQRADRPLRQGDADRRPARRRAPPGQPAGRQLAPRLALAHQAGQVDPRAAAVRAPAGSAGDDSGVRAHEHPSRARSGRSWSRRTWAWAARAWRATRSSTRWASPSRTTTAPALWRDQDNNLPVDATGTMPGYGREVQRRRSSCRS